MSDAPEVSVVVACMTGRDDDLSSCLRSLLPQCDDAVEVIVAVAAPPDPELREHHPRVRFVGGVDDGPAETRVFRMRQRGIDAARGRFVALTEDHCRVSAGWLAALVAALEREKSAIAGGPVACGSSVSGA